MLPAIKKYPRAQPKVGGMLVFILFVRTDEYCADLKPEHVWLKIKKSRTSARALCKADSIKGNSGFDSQVWPVGQPMINSNTSSADMSYVATDEMSAGQSTNTNTMKRITPWLLEA